MSLKDKILAAQDRKAEVVEVPEWGVTVEVRGMSGTVRARFMERLASSGQLGKENADFAQIASVIAPLYPDLVADGVYDPESGQRVFSVGDIEALLEKNGEVLERLAVQVFRLSGLTKKAVDDAKKSSSPTPSAEPTSSSPSA